MIRIEGETRGKGGRKATPIEYKEVEQDGSKCVIGTILFKNSPIEFIIDSDDFEKVKSRNWYLTCNGLYVGSGVVVENKRKTLYLHNFVMNKLDFPGRGTKESVDHINRNGLDNRKVNLRLVSQTQQNINQKKKPRKTILPEGFADLPRHVYYVKPRDIHGDRFAIEMKSEGIQWNSSSSKKKTLQEKFEETMAKLSEFYLQFPHLRPA